MNLRLLLFPLLVVIFNFWFENLIFSNDSLGLISIANEINLSDISSFYNGVYPPGFTIILKLIITSGLDILLTIKIINFLFLSAFSYGIYFGLKKHVSINIILLSLTIAFLSNKTFSSNIISSGSYPIFLFFGTIGLLAFYQKENKFFGIGCGALALSSFMRYEGFILIISILIAELIFGYNKKKQIWIFMSLIFSSIIILIINYFGATNLVNSPHSIFHKEPNWIKIYPNFIFETVSINEFFHFYYKNIISHSYLLLLLAGSLYKFKNLRNLIISLIIFYLLIKLHPSPRGIFIIIPLLFIFISEIIFSLKGRNKIISIGLLTPVFLYFLLNNYYDKKKKSLDFQSYKKIEKSIATLIPYWNIENVFTNSFDFYSKNQLPNTPKVNGGWPKFLPSYYEKNPNFDLLTIDSFSKSLELEKIDFVIIDLAQLDMSIYLEQEINTLLNLEYSSNFKFISEIDKRYKVYQVLIR